MGPSSAILGHLGRSWAICGPSWGHLGANLEANGGPRCVSWMFPVAQGPKIIEKTMVFNDFWFAQWGLGGGHLGAILGPSWGLLGPSWGHLGASWGLLRPSCGHLGAFLGPLGANFGPPLGRMAPKWPNMASKIAQRGPKNGPRLPRDDPRKAHIDPRKAARRP